MLALAQWSPPKLIGVLTDIDDTLTRQGQIEPEALQALTALKAAGLMVMAITGRPVGWSEPFAGDWPVDAIVTENGAVALQKSAQGLVKTYQQDAATRAENFSRMQAVLHHIEQTIQGASRSQDSWGRETDIAIDHSEFTQLAPKTVTQVVQALQSQGLHATVSSIHINAWFGEHNKLQGARWALRTLFGRDLDAELDQWVYVGDSTNDQLMFEHLPHSVGVANIQDFADQLSHPPRYVTQGARGQGFAELVQHLLKA